MKSAREIIFVLIVAGLAYSGGYFYGRYPRTDRELQNSKSLVIASTEANLLTPQLQAWLEVHWGHSLIVRVLPLSTLQKHINEVDLIIGPKASLDPLRPQLADRPNIDLSDVDSDFLRHGLQSIPLLWKLSPLDDGRYRLLLIEMAWTPRSQRGEELVSWMLGSEFQKLWAEKTGMKPVNHKLLEKDDSTDIRDIREIPLDKLRYD